MRRTTFFMLAFLCSVAASAGTISSVSPSSVDVASGEYFLTVYGTSLGSQITFDGPAGKFTLNVNATTSSPSSVVTWIPQEVVNRGGRYTVTAGTSNAVNFDVIDPKRRFVLQVPEFLFASALSRDGAIVKYEVSTWSAEKEPEPPRIECSPKSGSQFKFGTTRVDCVATNAFGERDVANFAVNVLDNTGPDLKFPKDIVAEQSEEGGAVVKFDTSAFDAIDGDLRVTCNRSSGSLFPVGRTNVTCTATDFSLNPAVASFVVDVRGKGRLAIRVPENLVAEAEGPEGALVEYQVEAYGTEDANPTVKCDPPSGEHFRLGLTTVKCAAEDRFGNRAEGGFDLNVVDTLGPVLRNLYTSPEYLVPLDGRMISVALVTDPVDMVDPSPRCSVTGITANEQISLEDWKIVSDREVALRAATNGKTDRIYRISVTCTDSNRNESSAVANVTVPANGEAPKPGSNSAVTGRRRAGGK